MTILPFIMIGIGVDGMFVLQAALDLTDPADPMEDRMGYTLAHAGVSVTVASLTNFAAFIIGSNTSLPALRAFSVYAALGLLFDLILQARSRGPLQGLAAPRGATARRLHGRRAPAAPETWRQRGALARVSYRGPFAAFQHAPR